MSRQDSANGKPEVEKKPGRDYSPPRGNTWNTITASVDNLKEQDFEKFFRWIYGELIDLKKGREVHYSSLREKRWARMAFLREALVWLGIAAALATVIAAAAPLIAAPDPSTASLSYSALLVALAAYAIMGAIGLYERGTDLSATYFRLLAATVSIRNQWNRLQLSLLKEFPALIADPDKSKSRARVCEIAEQFCTELDKIVAAEREGWQTAFIRSMTDLDKAAADGLKETQTKMATLLTEAQKAVEAGKPTHAIVELTGGVDGEVEVFVDDAHVATEQTAKFVLTLPPGPRKLTVKAKKGGKEVTFADAKQIKAGAVETWKLNPA